MASRYYGLDRGDNQFVEPTEGSSTGTKDVEIAIDLAIGMSRSEVLVLIDQIKNKILVDTWPPA